MNVVLHIPTLQSGGAERQLAYLAMELANRGRDVHVVTFYTGGLFWDQLSVHPHIKLYSLNRNSKFDFHIVYKLIKYCKENNVHVMHAFLPPSSVIAALSSIFLNIPLIIGIRSSDMRFKPGGHVYKYAERVLGNFLAELYVSNSRAGLEYNVSIGYKESIMRFVPNGLNLPDKKFNDPFQEEGVIRICMIGRLLPVKDIPTMLHAFSLLSDDLGYIELLIYGDGDTEYKQKLLNQCVELNIVARVIWKGWTSSVWSALEGIDILVSSSYSEGMSNTLMEGLAAQRVVISTDVGDARSFLDSEYGQAGYLVPSSNAKLLFEALHYAITHRDESLTYAERGRRLIDKKYSIDAMVDGYDSIYKEVLN